MVPRWRAGVLPNMEIGQRYTTPIEQDWQWKINADPATRKFECPTANRPTREGAPLRIARRRHLAIDLGAHLHHSISDFGLICLRQIIRTNIEQFRHGIANKNREFIARPDIPRCGRSDNCHFSL